MLGLYGTVIRETPLTEIPTRRIKGKVAHWFCTEGKALLMQMDDKKRLAIILEDARYREQIIEEESYDFMYDENHEESQEPDGQLLLL